MSLCPQAPQPLELTVLAFLALQAIPIFFAQLSGTPPFPLPVLGFRLLIVRKAVYGKGFEGEGRVSTRSLATETTALEQGRVEESGWTLRTGPPRTTLNLPLGKTLLSVRSRSTSLPPESEEWELWGVAVPRGEEHSLNARASLPSNCLQISGTQSKNYTYSGAFGEGRLWQGQDSYLRWRHQSYRGRALQGHRYCCSRGWPGGHHPVTPGQKDFPDLRKRS